MIQIQATMNQNKGSNRWNLGQRCNKAESMEIEKVGANFV